MRKELIPDFYNNFLAKPKETLYEHTYRLLCCLEDLKHYLNDDEYSLLEYCCIYHDVGKINKYFQQRVISDSKIKFNDKKEVGHNILSFLYVFNNAEKIPDGLAHGLIFNIILNHHHYVNNFYELEKLLKENSIWMQNYRDSFEEDPFAIDELLDGHKIKEIKRNYNFPKLRDSVLKGFFHKCDYAASANLPVEICNDNLLRRLYEKKYIWNDMQVFSRNHTNDNLIVVGSTGLGKTEASLLWQGESKGFYILPVRTAINAMYERLKNDFYPKDYDNQLGLLHGETQNIYISDENIDDSTSFWEYFEKTKNRAYPLTICTPDQIFKFVFKYPGYEADLATLSYSKIIMDEIQAYSPDLLAAIIYGLQTINKAGGKFAITTATLAPVIRDFLDMEFDNDGNKLSKKIELNERQFLNKTVRHRVKICDDFLEVENIINFYHDNESLESLKILIVVNTVTKAQKIYKQLVSGVDSDYVNLLHSKFVVKHRRNLENKISEDGRTDVKKHVVWIATQVVEASLDIDFDFLFTEFSDLSGLFQRMGRCNRKGVKPIQEYNVYVYAKIEEGLLCRKNASLGTRKNGFIYNSLYTLGVKALKKWKENSIDFNMTEEDKVGLINEFYTTEKVKSIEKYGIYASYIKDYYERYKRLINITPMDRESSEIQDKFRNILSVSAIPNEIYQKEYDLFMDIEEEIKKKYIELKKSNIGHEKSKIKLDLIKLRNQIIEYTLPIEPYRVDKTLFLLKGKGEFRISNNNYGYNESIGFFKKENEDQEAIFW